MTLMTNRRPAPSTLLRRPTFPTTCPAFFFSNILPFRHSPIHQSTRYSVIPTILLFYHSVIFLFRRFPFLSLTIHFPIQPLCHSVISLSFNPSRYSVIPPFCHPPFCYSIIHYLSYSLFVISLFCHSIL